MSDPRVGFLGVGRIARQRMEAMLAAEEIEPAAVCDPSLDCVREALKLVPDAVIVPDMKEMLELGLDAIVIASPASMHARHAAYALKSGTAIFCQKPLGLTGAETRAAVDAGKAADRLLGVDLPYRFTEGMQRIREYIAGGEIGRPFAAELCFHVADGPDKGWRFGIGEAGSGAMTDLGSHLIDLALWTLGFPAVERVEAHLMADGEALEPGERGEDYGVATLTLEGGAVVRIACSWRAKTGRDAVIEAQFHGTQGGASMRNVGGAISDFRAELYRGTSTETLSSPGEPWEGRAAARWAARLASGERFDPAAEHLVVVADVLDRIHGR